jgi:prepilin-type N-terminal cleavage/methylation domain-containing protein
MTRRPDGYSLIEMVISMAIVSAVAAGAFRLIDIAHRTAEPGEEAAEMMQRLRSVTATLQGELLRAGAGASNDVSGAFSGHVPAVLPFQPGDPPGTFRGDLITVVYARVGAVQAATTAALTSVSTAFSVSEAPGCPPAQAACGMKAGDTAVVFDAFGNFDAFSITGVSGSGGAMVPLHAPGAGVTTYSAGASIVAVEQRTYTLKDDTSGRPYELVSYMDGSAAAPVAEHIVSLRFDYFDDPGSLQAMSGPDAAGGPLRIRGVAVTLRVEAGNDALRGAARGLFMRPGTAVDVTRTLPDVEAQFHVSLRNAPEPK